jgi:hypothetical protein
LSIERAMIPVHYMTDIDGSWRFTDAAGHPHHCAYDAADHYPTLTLVTATRETYWCSDCEDEHEHEDAHLECRQCHEVVRPGMTGPGVKYISGQVTCTLDGEIISEEQARALAAEWTFRG